MDHCHASPQQPYASFFWLFITATFKEQRGEETRLSGNGFVLWSDVKPYMRTKYLRKKKRNLPSTSHVAKRMGQREIEAIWRQAGSIKIMITAPVSCVVHTCSDSDDERGTNTWVSTISFTSGVRGPVAHIRTSSPHADLTCLDSEVRNLHIGNERWLFHF